ncbi:MAG: hypothetical protein R3B99_12525 [Polyangiales bacterium]
MSIRCSSSWRTPFQIRDLFDELGELGFVFPGHLEQLEKALHVARQAVPRQDRLFGACTLSHQLLGLLSLVPEAFAEGKVRESIDLVSQAIDVKDTSPAHQGAGRGPRARRASHQRKPA